LAGFLTVVVPAASRQLVSLADAKDALSLADDAQDAQVQKYIDRASALIAAEVRAPLGVEVLSEVFRLTPYPAAFVGPYGQPLNARVKPIVLARSPVVSVSAVMDFGGTLDPANYECELGSGLLYRLWSGVRTAWTAPPVTVAYSAGYVLPDDLQPGAGPALPLDIQQVCLDLITSAWMRKGRDIELQYELVQDVGRNQYFPRTTSATMALDEAMCAVLAPYVNRAW
jgi:hypothetical protein